MEHSLEEVQSEFAMDLRFVTQESLEGYCNALTVIASDAPQVREALLGLATMSLLQDAQLYASQLPLLGALHAQAVHAAH